jgi:hypothetical protein
MKYSWDANIWVRLVLPYIFKKPLLLNMFEVLLVPFQGLHTSFIAYRASVILRTNYSCQQGSLSILLNKIFADDIGTKTFSIDTVSDIKPKYYAPVASDTSGLFEPVYSGMGSEADFQKINVGFGSEYNNGLSFIVNAPIEAIGRESEIKAWVNYYRFATKQFTIKYF